MYANEVMPLYDVSRHIKRRRVDREENSPVGDASDEGVKNREVELRIAQSLIHLVPVPPFVGRVLAGAVLDNTGSSVGFQLMQVLSEFWIWERDIRDTLLPGTEPSHFVGRPQDEITPNRANYGEGAQEQRDTAPSGEARVVFRVSSDAVQDQVADDGNDTFGRLPEERAAGMLFGLVLGTGDLQESGFDSTFEEALEGSQHNQGCKVLGGTDADDRDALTQHVEAQGPADLPPLQQVDRWEFANQVHQVENGGQPLVLLPVKPGIFAHAKHRLNTDGVLVDDLDAIDEETWDPISHRSTWSIKARGGLTAEA